MLVTIRIFNDINKNGIYDTGETLFTDKFITVRKADGTCTSSSTGATGILTLNLDAGDVVYETLQNITGTYPTSYFDNLVVQQIADGYISTTARKLMVFNNTTSINFGHCVFTPVPCDENAYIITNPQNDSFLKSILLATGAITDLKTYTNYNLNALSYNQVEKLLYAGSINASQSGLYRIEGPTGNTATDYTLTKINKLYDITNYEEWLPGTRFIATADNNGFIYFASSQGNNTLSKINMNPQSLNYLYVQSININNLGIYSYADWAINSITNKIYFFADNNVNKIIELDLNTNTLTEFNTDTSIINVVNPTGQNRYRMVGAFFTDNGYLYLLSATGYIYIVNMNNLTDKVLNFFSRLPDTLIDPRFNTNGDGANCSSYIIRVDFGNAPETPTSNTAGYHSSLANLGPRHVINYDIMLGEIVLDESDATSGPTAKDNDGTNYPLTIMPFDAATYTISVKALNRTGNPATLYGWLDFNTDGIFQVDEAITPITVPSNASEQTIDVTFTRPAGYVTALTNTFIRLRFTTANLDKGTATGTQEDPRSLSLNGAAPNGEVEDYQLETTEHKPDIRCKKIVIPSTGVSITGETVTYQINVKNFGSITANSIKVMDDFTELLEDLQFIDGHYVINGNPAVPITNLDTLKNGIEIGSLAQYEEANFTLNFKVK